jgi:hypothetical protein
MAFGPIMGAQSMAQDPLSRVAAWLTPATPGEVADEALTASPPEDPVIALIAEAKRLDALWFAATNRGDEILDTLPEDIREGRVRISITDGELSSLLWRHAGFTSEAHLHRWVDVHRRLAMVRARHEVETGRISAEDLAAEEAEFNREVGLNQALAQFRAGVDEIKAIREASGCEAHYREAEGLARRAGEIENQIRNTKPVTIAGAIAMLELGLEGGCVNESLINAAIAGLRDMQPEASRISSGVETQAGAGLPMAIGFGEPEEGVAA